MGDPLDAGEFGPWLQDFRLALDGDPAADGEVPCDGCTACCRSAQFVHIEPDETDTLAHVPAELLAPAPMLPVGHMVLGYDDEGRCPMLTDHGCSIHAHRPRTCRSYDCRVFAAGGIEADPDSPLVVERARRWRFRHPTVEDRRLHDEIIERARELEAAEPDADPTRIALGAVAPTTEET